MPIGSNKESKGAKRLFLIGVGVSENEIGHFESNEEQQLKCYGLQLEPTFEHMFHRVSAHNYILTRFVIVAHITIYSTAKQHYKSISRVARGLYIYL